MNFGVEQSLTTFSSEGGLKHCEAALTAALAGSLAVGTCSSDGCVLASLRNANSLTKKTFTKVKRISKEVGMTYAGLQPDFTRIASSTANFCLTYKMTYNSHPTGKRIARATGEALQAQTQAAGTRPLGVLVLLTALNDGTPSLYQLDPSGCLLSCDVAAVGKDYAKAKEYLKGRIENTDDNIFSCVEALREFAGYAISPEDVDLGVLRSGGNFEVYTPEMVAEIFATH